MDNKMNDILKNFASASGEKNSPMLTDSETGGPKQNKALIEKNAMKKLLEGLDAGQKKAKQMPATHVMPKEKKGAKHPVGDYLVGGAEGDVPEDEEKLDEVDIDEEKLGKKRSLFDILQTMESEDEEDEKETRDFHKKEKKSAQNYKRGVNGKPNLAENADNAMYDLRAHIQNLAYFSTSIDMIGEEFDTNNGDTFVVLAKKIVKAVKEIRAENSPVKFKEDGPTGTKSQDIHTRDPRASQIIKKARNEYSIAADDDLGAIVNMMHDTDVDHDAGIDDNSDVNDDQESDISAILKRLADLERGKL